MWGRDGGPATCKGVPWDDWVHLGIEIRFGEALGRLRRGLDLTQKDLVDLMGEGDETYVSDIERGAQLPSATVFTRLILGLTRREPPLSYPTIQLLQALWLREYQGPIAPSTSRISEIRGAARPAHVRTTRASGAARAHHRVWVRRSAGEGGFEPPIT